MPKTIVANELAIPLLAEKHISSQKKGYPTINRSVGRWGIFKDKFLNKLLFSIKCKLPLFPNNINQEIFGSSSSSFCPQANIMPTINQSITLVGGESSKSKKNARECQYMKLLKHAVINNFL